MWWIAVMVTLAACGRIDFDPLGAGGDAANGDAIADAAGPPRAFVVDEQISTSSELYGLDITSGRLTFIGSFGGLGEFNGVVATGNDTVLVATYQGTFYRITVPSGNHVSIGGDTGAYVGLDTGPEGTFAIDEVNDTLVALDGDPTVSVAVRVIGAVHTASTGVDLAGGDLTHVPGRGWYLVSNTTHELMSIDVASALATVVGSYDATEELTGLASIQGVVYAISRSSDDLLELDLDTGAVVGRRTVCFSCPTAFDIGYGDMAAR